MHETLKVRNDERKKTQVHVMYDHSNGEVVVTDLLSANHSTRMNTFNDDDDYDDDDDDTDGC